MGALGPSMVALEPPKRALTDLYYKEALKINKMLKFGALGAIKSTTLGPQSAPLGPQWAPLGSLWVALIDFYYKKALKTIKEL